MVRVRDLKTGEFLRGFLVNDSWILIPNEVDDLDTIKFWEGGVEKEMERASAIEWCEQKIMEALDQGKLDTAEDYNQLKRVWEEKSK